MRHTAEKPHTSFKRQVPVRDRECTDPFYLRYRVSDDYEHKHLRTSTWTGLKEMLPTDWLPLFIFYL